MSSHTPEYTFVSLSRLQNEPERGGVYFMGQARDPFGVVLWCVHERSQ